ncbi:MAG TPA: hypothetical protein VF746_24205 [Longimicrobium sp.]|jgi:hypothetical protein
MRTPKLKLEIEALAVESFPTAPAADGRGTVHGAQEGAFAGVGADTGCTAPCLSEESWCPILSCGSSCDPETTVPEPGKITD